MHEEKSISLRKEAISLRKEVWRIFLVIVASIIIALNLNSFVHYGDLIPGGFTGITLLLQRLLVTFFNVEIPFSIINIPLNLIPAAICFKYIGKRFTVYSLISIVLTGVLVDILPYYDITYDPLLTGIFGGLINGFAVGVCLRGNATTGGTDFISALLSKKYKIDSWNYIFAGNAVVLIIAGLIYGWDKAMYSIIYQFITTQVLHMMYKRYQRHTLFIITDKPQEVYNEIREETNHGATLFKGIGCYKNEERNMLYSVVSSDEIHAVLSRIKRVDESAFIDIIQTDRIAGWFYEKPTK